MKKILAILLTVAMLLGCVSATMFVSAAEGLTAATVPETVDVTVYGGTNTFSVPVTIDEAADGISCITLNAYVDASVVTASDTVEVSVEGIADAFSAILKKGTTTAGKKVLAACGIASTDYANYTSISVDLEGAITAPVVATFTFTTDAVIADGTTINFGVVALEGYAADEETELEVDDTVSSTVITIANDATFAALAEQYAETEGPVYVIDSVEVEPGATYADVKVFVLNNDEEDYDGLDYSGIWGTRTYIEVPKALTMAATAPNEAGIKTIAEYQIGNVFTAKEFTAGLADAEISSNGDAQDAWDVAYGESGLDQANYKATCLYFQSELTDDSTGTPTPANRYGEGVAITVRIYLPENAKAGQSWDLLFAHWAGLTSKGQYSSDTSDKDNALIEPTVVNGKITVAGEAEECFHENTTQVVVTEPTCTTAGSANIVCTDCEAIVDTVEIPVASHTAVSANNAVAATCTKEGKEADIICSVCKVTLTEGAAIAKVAHTPGEKVVTVEPTTEAEGAYEIKCTVCEEVLETGAIDKLLVAQIAVADASADVNVDVKVPVTINDNPGVWAVKVNITLPEGLALKGIEDGLFAVVEGENYSVKDGVLTVFVDNAAIANVTAEGTLFTLVFGPADQDTYNFTIEVVEVINVDEEDVPFTAVNGRVVVACDHDYKDVVTTPATIDAEGVLSTVCSKCSDVAATAPIAKLAALVVAGPATVAQNDEFEVTVGIKNNPGVWSVGFVTTYDETQFTVVSVAGVAAENYSVNDGEIKVFVDNDAIANITDDVVFVTITYKANVDAMTGTYSFAVTPVEGNIINVDGDDVAVETVDAEITVKAHDHVAGEAEGAVAATCTEAGATGTVKCTICGEVLSENEVIPATGHNYVNRYCEACGTGIKLYDNGYCYYEVNGAVANPGVVEFDGVYYVTVPGGRIVTNETVKIYAARTNGLIDAGTYEADENGALTEVVLNGIIDGYYYVDGATVNAGVVEVEGNYYFVTSGGKVVTSADVTVYSSKANGLVTPGDYVADENGVLTLADKNGIIDGYYYVDGVTVNAGVVEVDGNYYFVTSGGKVVTSADVKVYSTKANGLIAAGDYTADANGVLTAVVKNGIVDGYYYVNGEVANPGVVEVDGKLYYTTSGGKIVTDTTVTIYYSRANGLIAKGTYSIGADGVIVQ